MAFWWQPIRLPPEPGSGQCRTPRGPLREIGYSMDTTPHEQNTGGSDAPLGAAPNDIIRHLAGFVAGVLGEEWRVDVSMTPSYGYPVVFLDGPDHARLRMSLEAHGSGRVKISGIYPPHRVQPVADVEITVARDRGPAVIGQEITRRLLVRYRVELARVRARTLEQGQEAETRRLLLEQLLSRLGPKAHAAGESGDRGRLRVHNIGGLHGHLDVDSTGQQGTIYLSSAPGSLLLAIADLIGACAPAIMGRAPQPDTP